MLEVKETVLRKMTEEEIELLSHQIPEERMALPVFRANLRRCPSCNMTHPEYPVNEYGISITPVTFAGNFDYAIPCPVTNEWIAVRLRNENEVETFESVFGNAL